MLLVEHDVPVEASSFQEGESKIAMVRELGCEVAVLHDSFGSSFYPTTGAGMALKIREEFPGMRIVFCSPIKRDWGDANLEVPFLMQDLLNAVSG